MKILHLSDTHGLHQRLGAMPEADVMVHTGDFTNWGTEEECLDFINWFIDLPYAYKIFVCGNHDICLWGNDGIKDKLPANVHFLQGNGVTIGGVKFYGFGYGDDYSRYTIPCGTQVLLTHEPPFGILDSEEGSKEILKKIVKHSSLKLHLFGHSHNDNGVLKKEGITFSNGSLTAYSRRSIVMPRVIEI